MMLAKYPKELIVDITDEHGEYKKALDIDMGQIITNLDEYLEEMDSDLNDGDELQLGVYKLVKVVVYKKENKLIKTEHLEVKPKGK